MVFNISLNIFSLCQNITTKFLFKGPFCRTGPVTPDLSDTDGLGVGRSSVFGLGIRLKIFLRDTF